MLDKIKTFHSELKALLLELPSPKDDSVIDVTIVEGYNESVRNISNEVGETLERFAVSPRDRVNDKRYYLLPLRTQLGRLIGFLEGKFDLTPINNEAKTAPNVMVINRNTVALTVTQSLEQIIQNASEKEKAKLEELKVELEKPEKDWSKIKAILKWALDFSERLFFQLLPIILKHYNL